MELRRFDEVTGICVEAIAGQKRFGFSVSDTEDFYDMPEWQKRGGYPGAVLRFYDYESGKVFCPFGKKRNVLYGKPVYAEGKFYFLQGNFDRSQITLYRYLPEEMPETVTTFSIDAVNLYNLMIMGKGIHVVSIDDSLVCYYPEKFEIPLQPTETPVWIEENRIYIEAWVEEGWDTERDQPSSDYKFYNRVCIKDFSGRTLSEEIGALHQAEDGTWWIS